MNSDLLIHLTRPERVHPADWEEIRGHITSWVMDELAANGVGFSYQGGPLVNEAAEIRPRSVVVVDSGVTT